MLDKITFNMYAMVLVDVMCIFALIISAAPLAELSTNYIRGEINECIEFAFVEEEEDATAVLDKPALALEGHMLSVSSIEGASSYEVYVGHTLLTTLSDADIVDLSDYITSPGIHVIKVVAKSNEGTYSGTSSVGYYLETPAAELLWDTVE